MKIPKLKYYYVALNSNDYEEFELTRQVPARPVLYLYARPTVADTRFRQLTHSIDTVYVLRIPSDLVPRSQLTAAPDPEGMWIYSQSIALPHCGVERFEIDTTVEPPVEMITVATSRPMKIVIPVV